MRIHGHTLRNRRGVGAIIGGAFFLLIMLVGYMVYSFSIQAINNQQQVLSDMRAYDIERSREAFKSDTGAIWSTDNLLVSIQNIGPRPADIICIGIWDGTLSEWNYYREDVPSFLTVFDERTGLWRPFSPPEQIQAGSYKKFNAYIPEILKKTTDWTYKLQFLTDKGTIYEVGYPDSRYPS
jgi:hypothetical protein